ncbi:MAG: hypothetical protein K9K32_04590 [Halanaerobiales bacterium]|nr:hypothetical protein [Halanaerobiales bacterium]
MPDFKPEFGNRKQIEKIKKYKREKEAYDNSDWYKVELEVNNCSSYEIQANSKEEAIEKAGEKYFDALIDWADYRSRVLRKIVKAEEKGKDKINNTNNNLTLF